jgi:hypothetical protein
LTIPLMKYIGHSGIHSLTAFYLALHAAVAADLPNLRIQTWTTVTHIFWVRAIAGDRVAVSYFNAGSGLDVLDSSGTVVRRAWPLPAGTHCAAVYPDGNLFLLPDNSVVRPDAPAAVLPDGSVVTTDDDYTPLVLFDTAASNGRDFASGVFDPSLLSRIGGIASQQDGKIVLWGDFSLADGSFRTLIRLNSNESLDKSFNPDATGDLLNLRIAGDGTLLVETLLPAPPSSELRKWVRLNADGTLISSFGITAPDGTSLHAPAVMLDDGSVIVSVEGGNQLQRFFTDGSSSTRGGIGFWSSFWDVSNLLPFPGGSLAFRQSGACEHCRDDEWLRILPGEGNAGQMVTWVPPAPAYFSIPMLLVEGLQPEAEYVVEATTDLRYWQPVFGLQVQNFERSADRRSLFLRDSETLDLGLSRRFYRTRKLN